MSELGRLDHYRVNYDVEAWRRITQNGAINCLPFGAVLAIDALLAEIERLKAAELVARDKALEEVAQLLDKKYNRIFGKAWAAEIRAMRSTDGEMKNG